MDIRGEIRHVLDNKGISFRDLARTSGVSYSSIQRYLSDNGDLSSDNFLLILKSIDLDISILFREDAEFARFKNAPDYLKKGFRYLTGG